MDQKTLKDLLTFDPATGEFRWKIAAAKRTKVGSIAGSLTNEGYLRIQIKRHIYMAHRLAWFYKTGEWPEGEIDHINGVRNDNRLVNLRTATHTQNMRNYKKPLTNRSGFKGVYWHSRDRRWIANIRALGKTIHLGCFETPEEAHAAYVAAAKQYHGEFANF